MNHRTELKESAPSRAQRLAQYGDVFYQTVRPYQRNNYLYVLPYENYVFSTGYAQIRPCIDSYFLLSCLQEDQFVKRVLDNCTGTSYPAINSTDLAEIKVDISVNKQEQTTIGDFFRQLDAAIASHQRKPVLQKASKIKQADTISACFWLAKSSQMPHHNIGILIFKFLNNMNISVLRGGHARMPEPSRHAGNRYPGKKQ